MNGKILILFLALSFPFVVVGQKKDILTPQADIMFKKRTIYYIINPDVAMQIEPLSYPQSYKTEYKSDMSLYKTYFANREDMFEFLDTIDIDKAGQKEILLFLRAASLYKIWSQIGYAHTTLNLNSKIQGLLESDTEEISSFASQVLKIK